MKYNVDTHWYKCKYGGWSISQSNSIFDFIERSKDRNTLWSLICFKVDVFLWIYHFLTQMIFFNCSYKHRTRWLGKVKDTKGARRSSNWKNRQYTSKRNRQNDKLWSATYIKENKRLNNSNPTKITGMNSSDLEEEAIPAPLMTPVVVGIG